MADKLCARQTVNLLSENLAGVFRQSQTGRGSFDPRPVCMFYPMTPCQYSFQGSRTVRSRLARSARAGVKISSPTGSSLMQQMLFFQAKNGAIAGFSQDFGRLYQSKVMGIPVAFSVSASSFKNFSGLAVISLRKASMASGRGRHSTKP